MTPENIEIMRERLMGYDSAIIALERIEQREAAEKLQSFAYGFERIFTALELGAFDVSKAEEKAAEISALASGSLLVRPSVEFAEGAKVASALAKNIERRAR